MRLLLIFLTGICACNAAAISEGDESILLKAILNASNGQNDKTKRPIWTIFKSLFLRSIHNEYEDNLGDKESSTQEAAVLQNSLRNDKEFDEKGISKSVISANATDEISKNENVHPNDSANIGFHIAKNENMSRKHLDSEIFSAKPIELLSETQFELGVNKNDTYYNFTLNSTDYTTDFLVLQEDLDSIESLSVNENDLMRGGGEIALFQEMPTTGFEFLIDSETKRNMILSQLFTSPNLALEDFMNLEESLNLDSALANLKLDEGVAAFNITSEEEKFDTSSMQEIFNVTKGWSEFPQATDLMEDGFNFNVSDVLPIVNVKLTDLPKESSFKHSESSPVTMEDEAEFSGMLLANASMNKSQELDKSSKVELKIEKLASNTSDFDYKEPTNLHNFEDFSVSGIQIPLLNLSEKSETYETILKSEAFDLVNNSQGFLEKENVGKEIFSLSINNDRSGKINSSDFTDQKELVPSIPLTQVALDENGREELNTKMPVEVLNLNLSHTLQSMERTENLHSNMSDFDWNSNKVEFDDPSHSSLETFRVTTGENKKLGLNTTQVQNIFGIVNDTNTLSEGTERTLFVLSSNNYTNGSTRIGETSDSSKEDFKDFISRTQLFDLNESGEAQINLTVPFEEILNLTNSKGFPKTKIAETSILNTTDFSNSITEFKDFTNFEDYPTSLFENTPFTTDENGDPIENMKSIPKAVNTVKDFDVFSAQSETENFRLNVTDILQNGPIQPAEDATREKPTCPEPGVCILWFFARDSCIKDSQCDSAQKCCKIGCSNVCLSV